MSHVLVTYFASPVIKTQLWSIYFGHSWIWEHPEILICLIKLTKEWRLDWKSSALRGTEMCFALKMELEAHGKWGIWNEMLEGTAGNSCEAHFHFCLNTTEAALDLLKIKRYIKNAKHKILTSLFSHFLILSWFFISLYFEKFSWDLRCSSTHPWLLCSKAACYLFIHHLHLFFIIMCCFLFTFFLFVVFLLSSTLSLASPCSSGIFLSFFVPHSSH